jgi:outer membrane protein
MKRHYIFLVSLLLPLGVIAQKNQTDNSFTLDQCIQYALQSAISVKNSGVDQDIALAKVRETRGIGLPQINGNVSMIDNQNLRRFFAKTSVLSGFEPGITFPGLGPNDVVASQNFFQLKNSSDIGLNFNQIIFNGSYIVGLQAANAYKDLAYKNANQTKESVIEQVSKAYYAALINLERIDLFSSNIARVDSLLKNTVALRANGFAEEIDVDRIQVSLNNLITERDNFINVQTLSVELLKFQMNYPMDQELSVAGDLSQIPVEVNIDDYLKDWDYRNRPDYRVLEANRRLQELTVKNNYAAGLPSISANASLGYYMQSADFTQLFKPDVKFTSLDNGLLGPDKYYNYSSVGLTMNVPIFSGLQRTYRVQQEKLNLIKIDNNFRSLKSNVDLQVKQSTLTYQNNLRSLQSQKRNMDLAMKVAKVTRIKYEQGVGSNLEVVEAESSLKEAQVNYYNALYDVLVARVNIDKAFGKLLGNSTSSSN